MEWCLTYKKKIKCVKQSNKDPFLAQDVNGGVSHGC